MFNFLVNACGMRFKGVLAWVVARTKEPSSWASIATLLTFYGFNINQSDCTGIPHCIDQETWKAIIGTGVGLSGLIAIAMKEKGPEQTKINNDEITTFQEYPK